MNKSFKTGLKNNRLVNLNDFIMFQHFIFWNEQKNGNLSGCRFFKI